MQRSGTYMQRFPIDGGVRGVAGYSGINYWSGADWTSLRRVQQLCIRHCYFGIISPFGVLLAACFSNQINSKDPAGGLLSFIWPVFAIPSVHVDKLPCWIVLLDLMVINDGSLHSPVRYTTFLIRECIQFIIMIILKLFKSWPVTGVIQLFFFFFQLQSEKKACVWAFQPGALCGAVRSCADPLMCFLNYPHWIHYLFALLNLFNLAALQWRVKNWFRGHGELLETLTCGRTSKFSSAPSKVIKQS